MHCILCDRPLTDAGCEGTVDGGVVCTTKGNYGSRVYDTEGRDYLVFQICDACLTARRSRIVMVTPKRRVVDETTTTAW